MRSIDFDTFNMSIYQAILFFVLTKNYEEIFENNIVSVSVKMNKYLFLFLY